MDACSGLCDALFPSEGAMAVPDEEVEEVFKLFDQAAPQLPQKGFDFDFEQTKRVS